MSGPTSTPRGEHPGRPGATWNTRPTTTETWVAEEQADDTTNPPQPPTLPVPNRATRRAAARAARRKAPR